MTIQYPITRCDLDRGAEDVPDRLATGQRLLDAVLNRDTDGLRAVLHPDVRFRALLPSGLWESTGPDPVIDRFSTWFGRAEEFEVLHARVEQIGPRLHLKWRLRATPAPRSPGQHLIEQQVFADTAAGAGSGSIEQLDLLCTGFMPTATAMVRGPRGGR